MSEETTQVLEASNVGVLNVTSDAIQVDEIAEVTKTAKEDFKHV